MAQTSIRPNTDASPNQWTRSNPAMPHYWHVSNDPYQDNSYYRSAVNGYIEHHEMTDLDPGLDFGKAFELIYRVRVRFASLNDSWHGIRIQLFKESEGSPFTQKEIVLPAVVSSPANYDLVLGSAFELTKDQVNTITAKLEHRGAFNPFESLVEVSERELFISYVPSALPEEIEVLSPICDPIVTSPINDPEALSPIRDPVVHSPIEDPEVLSPIREEYDA